MRFLLHYEENQIGIDAIFVAVLSDQSIKLLASGAPAALLFSRRLCHFFHVLGLNAVYATALDKDRQGTPLIPNAGSQLGRAISFNTRATYKINPRGLIKHA